MNSKIECEIGGSGWKADGNEYEAPSSEAVKWNAVSDHKMDMR